MGYCTMKEGESYWGSLSLGSLVVMLNIVTAFINLKRKYIPSSCTGTCKLSIPGEDDKDKRKKSVVVAYTMSLLLMIIRHSTNMGLMETYGPRLVALSEEGKAFLCQ